MKKRKIYSPYYDFKTFQYKNPYLTSPTKDTSDRVKKFATAEEKINSPCNSFHGKRSVSHETLEARKIDQGLQALDLSANKLQDSLENFSDYRQLNIASKYCQTSSPLRRSPKRVPSQNLFSLNQQMMNKNARENQNTLRYLLKLSNNTFYATLKHEIDTLKKNEASFQQELSLQNLSILKILNCQKHTDEALEKIIFISRFQNQKLEEEFQGKGDLLCRLTNRVQSQKVSFDTYSGPINHCHSANSIEAMIIKTISEPNPENCSMIAKDLLPPRSAPSMIPRRKKVKKQVRVKSEPAIINRSELSCQSGGDRESESDLLTNLSGGCSELASELDISCSKNISWDSSKVRVNQRTIGTNYSANDFSAPSDTTSSTRSFKKRRPWFGFFCCK